MHIQYAPEITVELRGLEDIEREAIDRVDDGFQNLTPPVFEKPTPVGAQKKAEQKGKKTGDAPYRRNTRVCKNGGIPGSDRRKPEVALKYEFSIIG